MLNPTNTPAESNSRVTAAGYEFHSPEFVQWWLHSLYLLPLEQQLAAAQSLKDSVQVPAVHAVVDLFLLGLRYSPQSLQRSTPEAPVPEQREPRSPTDTAMNTLVGIWRERPAIIWVTVLACIVLAIRGVKFLAGMLGFG